MPDIDSTNDEAPFFGPALPNYPSLLELVHIPTGTSAVLGTKIYPAVLAQWNPNTLGFRDRASIYLQEANGASLVAGYYLGRLTGNYQGLPLFVTWCCPTFPSSSQSSH